MLIGVNAQTPHRQYATDTPCPCGKGMLRRLEGSTLMTCPACGEPKWSAEERARARVSS